MRVFFFHLNKPATKAAGRPQISIHHKGICHIVDGIDCAVPTESKISNRQPYFVMKGRCHGFSIEQTNDGKKIAVIPY